MFQYINKVDDIPKLFMNPRLMKMGCSRTKEWQEKSNAYS